MKKNFTPGPWKYGTTTTRKGRTTIEVSIPTGPTLVFGSLSEDDCKSPECCKREEHANAVLVSKSPDLFERLEESTRQLQMVYAKFAGQMWSNDRQSVYSAIYQNQQLLNQFEQSNESKTIK